MTENKAPQFTCEICGREVCYFGGTKYGASSSYYNLGMDYTNSIEFTSGGPNGENGMIGTYGGLLSSSKSGNAMTMGPFVFFGGKPSEYKPTASIKNDSPPISEQGFDQGVASSLAMHERGHVWQSILTPWAPLYPVIGAIGSFVPNILPETWTKNKVLYRGSNIKKKTNWFWGMDKQADRASYKNELFSK
jgi:hypothetical protein